MISLFNKFKKRKQKQIERFKIKTISVYIVLSLCILGFACKKNEDLAIPPAYLRVFDVRIVHGQEDGNRSLFMLDGSPYGNKAFDSIKIFNSKLDNNAYKDDFTLSNFGDFSLGRSKNYFGDNSFDEPIDYIGNQQGILPGPPSALPPYQDGLPYKDGSRDEGYVYFPNLTHHVSVAPVINGIDYYKWASFASGAHTLGYKLLRKGPTYPINLSNLIFGNSYTISDEYFVKETSYDFVAGNLYSLFLLSSDRYDETKTVMLRIQEDHNLQFAPDKVYVRFINSIPESFTPETNIIDIYSRTLNSSELKALEDNGTTNYDPVLLPGTGPEVKVSTGLKRFEVEGKLPYIEIDYSAFFKEEGGISAPNENGVPTTIFYVYTSGNSASNGSKPLYTFKFSNVGGSFAETFSGFDRYRDVNYIPALAKTTKGYAPVICTILVGTGGIYYNLEQASIRQAYIDKVSGR